MIKRFQRHKKLLYFVKFNEKTKNVNFKSTNIDILKSQDMPQLLLTAIQRVS